MASENRKLAEEAAPATLTEIESCSKEFLHFVDGYCWIEVPNADPIRFRLWKFQARLAIIMQTVLELIILKSRRLGLTWLALAYALWLTTFHANRYVIILSKGLDPAQNLIARVKFMWSHLPTNMREPLVEDQKKKLKFANGSRIEAFPDTESAGRQETASLVILEEHAFQRSAETNWAAVKPTTEGGGQIFIISTSNGKLNLFADLWHDAKGKLNNFMAVFLPWYVRPDRTPEWLESERKAYKKSPSQFLREYPEKETDAFAAPEGQYWEDYDPARHLLSADEFEIEPVWPIYRSVDFGLVQPSVHWHQETVDDKVITIGELDVNDKTTDELAEEIRRYELERGWDGLKIIGSCCDPAGHGRDPQTKESDITVFTNAHLNPISTRSSRGEGCDIMHTFLRTDRWFIVREWCPWLVSAMEDAVKDRDKNGDLRSDVYKEQQGVNGWSHCLDEVRYYFVCRWRNRGSKENRTESPPKKQRGKDKGMAGQTPDTAEDRPRKGRPATANIRHRPW